MKNKLISGLSSNFHFCILCNNEISFICVLFADERTLVTLNLLLAVICYNLESIILFTGFFDHKFYELTITIKVKDKVDFRRNLKRNLW